MFNMLTLLICSLFSSLPQFNAITTLPTFPFSTPTKDLSQIEMYPILSFHVPKKDSSELYVAPEEEMTRPPASQHVIGRGDDLLAHGGTPLTKVSPPQRMYPTSSYALGTKDSSQKDLYAALAKEMAPSRRVSSPVMPHVDIHSVEHFTNEWVVHIPGGVEKARQVIEEKGYLFVDKLMGFVDHYRIKKEDHPEINDSHSNHMTLLLLEHDHQILWAQQEVSKRREKRHPIDFMSAKTVNQPQHILQPIPTETLNQPRNLESRIPSEPFNQLLRPINEPPSSNRIPETVIDDSTVREVSLPIDKLKEDVEAETKFNKINQERTKNILTERKGEAINRLINVIKEQRDNIDTRALTEFVKGQAKVIGGNNAHEIMKEILTEIEKTAGGSDPKTVMKHVKRVAENDVLLGEPELLRPEIDRMVEDNTKMISQTNEAMKVSELEAPVGPSEMYSEYKNEGGDEKNNEKVLESEDPTHKSYENDEHELSTRNMKEDSKESEEILEDSIPYYYINRRSINDPVDRNRHDDHENERSDHEKEETNRNYARLVPEMAEMITDTLKIGSDQEFGNDRKSRYSELFNDTKWEEQWYLQDFRADLELPTNDLNVVPIYYYYRFSGRGVRVVIPDDGLEHTHEDLKPNYDPNISYDLNSNDGDPTPRITSPPRNVHGTRCAGEIAMVANNNKCGAGIAFGAKIGGIRMLDGLSTDRIEGEALKFKHYWVDIYSNSWGPKDDGKTLDFLGHLTMQAMVDGISEGRNGRGVIYIFAAGNGKDKGDTCACDPYVSSIFSVAIATCDRYGHVTGYSERCTGIIATAFSGGVNKHNVVTTDVNNSCTRSHTGTSAAAPLAAGVVALLLEANPHLTWRDVQHLLIWTSEVAPLADNYGWNKNGFGFFVSHDFGFGMINAFNLVTSGLTWVNVPPSSVCMVPVQVGTNNVLRSTTATQFEILTDACTGDENGEIRFLEHVQLNVDIAYPVRGDLQIILISPLGTRSHLLESRPLDNAKSGYPGWTFSTLHAWAEDPRGIWTVQVFDVSDIKVDTGTIHSMKLILHGTKEMPQHYENGIRTYDEFVLKQAD
uniref:Neuroendocrine convertase 1 n=1 Tax=Cacopsylla melanoneura TaxID=428564 RepID=A0A8D8SSG2_9HEMI